MFKRQWFKVMLLVLLLVSVPAHAQESSTQRDPWDLARRLLGFDAPYALPQITPLYAVGDTAEFWVSKADAEQRTKITAELAVGTADIYIWVEEGLSYNRAALRTNTGTLDQIWFILRRLSLYGQPAIIPDTNIELRDPNNQLTISDVDADPHLFILFAADLGDEAVIYNLHDTLPAQISPYSNQHEMLYVNTSYVPGASPSAPGFVGLIARGMYELLVNNHTPTQAQWLRESLALFATTALDMTDLEPNTFSAFLQMPNASLLQPGSLPEQGAQQLFMNYLTQRLGIGYIQDVFRRPGEGVAALDAALADLQAVDPVTLENLTARGLFADFVMTNAITAIFGRPFGDGRYLHTIAALPEQTVPTAITLRDQYDATATAQSVNQFGTLYLYVSNTNPASFTVAFNGRATTPLLNMPGQPDNHFYWSGRGRDQSATLTRTFDLAGVDNATLTFDVWYDLDPQTTYGYVEVSADGGATWAIVGTESSTTSNRYGAAYGAGYTGISNPQPPRPFPILGVTIDRDRVTIAEITADGPVSQTEIRVGDRIVGYDGQEWPETPDVIALLGNYAPGDTLELLIERGDERFDVPVVLGAHPTRINQPTPLWQPQSVNLSPFAGGEVLVRFEYVSLPYGTNNGIAIDNIAVAEIDFADDTESDNSAWTLNGWQRVNNTVDQAFLVQAASVGSVENPPSVRPLIGVGENATTGEWTFDVTADEVIIITVSGLNDNTDQPAQFDLIISEAG
jgi:hypothetical protein